MTSAQTFALPRPASNGRAIRLPVLVAAVVAALVAAAAYVIAFAPYRAGDDVGYNLGLVGGVLMLLLLPYSLRKRVRILRSSGAMKVWFLFHIWAGLLGPLLVLFHSTFYIGSFNGGVALASTLLVTASGTVGRFFYRRVHRGMTGSRATVEEMQAALAQEQQALDTQLGPHLGPHFGQLPAVGEAIADYIALATTPPAGRAARTVHFLSLAWRRRRVSRHLRRTLAAAGHGKRDSLLPAAEATLAAAQKSAQFATYERLFSLWHTIHIPFLYLLVLTAVVHVVAVHAY